MREIIQRVSVYILWFLWKCWFAWKNFVVVRGVLCIHVCLWISLVLRYIHVHVPLIICNYQWSCDVMNAVYIFILQFHRPPMFGKDSVAVWLASWGTNQNEIVSHDSFSPNSSPNIHCALILVQTVLVYMYLLQLSLVLCVVLTSVHSAVVIQCICTGKLLYFEFTCLSDWDICSAELSQ